VGEAPTVNPKVPAVCVPTIQVSDQDPITEESNVPDVLQLPFASVVPMTFVADPPLCVAFAVTEVFGCPPVMDTVH
jgi:hypothetical protein